jgi:hypothetical protein
VKTKATIFLVAIAALTGWQVGAQTNEAPFVRTNWVTAAPFFREVNHQLYNTQRSILWKDLQGDILSVSPNWIVISTFTMKPIYQAATTSREVDNYWGGIAGYRNVTTQVHVGDEKMPGQTILLKNYPDNLQAAVGQTIPFKALRTGTADYQGERLELWDYGTPHVVMVLATNPPPSAVGNSKALRLGGE